MTDLHETYKRLARAWPQEELAARYRSAERQGAHTLKDRTDGSARKLEMVATAVPPAATLGVAVYVLHMVRGASQASLAQRLIDNADRNAAGALHQCHRGLELDGAGRGYTTEEWVPVICDVAAGLLKSARLDAEPPTVVREAQNAISWLSRALIELDNESAETPSALSEASGRLLVVWVFAQAARTV